MMKGGTLMILSHGIKGQGQIWHKSCGHACHRTD